jgi:membrane protein
MTESTGAAARGRDGDDQRSSQVDERRAPDEPTDMPKESWFAVLKRTLKEFSGDKLTHWAAALTYYGILSLFPALLALVSILGLVGQSATQPLIDNLGAAAPGPAKDIVSSSLQSLSSNQGASGFAFVLGLAGAIWSASGYIGAFMDASNSIWDVEEGRPIWKKIPIRIAVTIVLLILVSVLAIMTVVSGPIAEQVGNLIGLGGTAVTIWNIAKWPVMAVLVAFMLALLYWSAPNVKQPGFRWVSPGGMIAVVLWVVASALFALYVANFGSYNKTYGSLGGVIIFLVWLWISNIAVLLGAEFNAELERGRQIHGGMDPKQEPYLEPRDTPKEKGATA